MREYRIRITGEYDVIVLSPQMIGTLIEKVRHSARKELVIPVEEIFPRGYAEYLSCVLKANMEMPETGTSDMKPTDMEPENIKPTDVETADSKPESCKPLDVEQADVQPENVETANSLPDRNVYMLAAEQIRKLQCNEQDCFDRVEVAVQENSPRFDMDASEEFYIMAKQENNSFRYVFKGVKNEEISILLEYMCISSASQCE